MAPIPPPQLDNMLLHGRGARPILRICDFGYSKDELGQSVSKSTCGALPGVISKW